QALNGRAGDRRPPGFPGAPAEGPAQSDATARERSQALNGRAGDRRPPGFPGAPAEGPARSDGTARERRQAPDSRKIPPFPRPWPVFKVPEIPRGFGTDAQWELGERERADGYRNMGIILGLMQWVCTRLGNHRRCRLRVCRRKRRCAGRRPEDRWNDGFLFPLVPPCEPIEDERIYQLRDEVNQVLWQAECHGAQTPPPPVRCAGQPLVFEDGQTPVRDAPPRRRRDHDAGRAETAEGATGRPGRANA
ncbi:MAG: hypothetical protein ABJL48_13550, partial [Nitratireductor sp.]